MTNIYYNILDEQRRNMLPLLVFLKDNFYLAGGTGLALQIGHRDSIDFDFFTLRDFDTNHLFKELKMVFTGKTVKKIQEEMNTLTVLIDEEIMISFLRYEYDLMEECIETEDMKIASMLDIGCMKCSAVISRSLSKDYIDLYFIIKRIGLRELLDGCSKKFRDIDISLILKSLIYFDDIIEERIDFKGDNAVGMEEVRSFLREEVRRLSL
ncbi:MAG: hypothetical protein BWY21_00846 [Parcubacteria group bacterium ADurb.Bin216]|jgi:hypothetical protein|nr:MAG: hypothetical protein BWY21_00846 [Parcubacteria group bacterium ADurb.Bin216]